jgi:hypothetical protein
MRLRYSLADTVTLACSLNDLFPHNPSAKSYVTASSSLVSLTQNFKMLVLKTLAFFQRAFAAQNSSAMQPPLPA